MDRAEKIFVFLGCMTLAFSVGIFLTLLKYLKTEDIKPLESHEITYSIKLELDKSIPICTKNDGKDNNLENIIKQLKSLDLTYTTYQ